MIILNIVSAVMLLLLAGYSITVSLESKSIKMGVRSAILILIAILFMVANIGIKV